MRAILLDMYGVIIKQTGDDFAPYIRRTFPKLTTEEIYVPWIKAAGGELTSAEVWRALGFESDIDEIEKCYLDTMEVSEGFYDFASMASASCKMAVISNDIREWSEYLRGKFDINKYFETISISGDLKMRKPDARIFELTIEQLGCRAEDCVYVDDREGNLKAASKIGMNAILFNSGHGRYEGKTVDDFAQLAKMLFYCD